MRGSSFRLVWFQHFHKAAGSSIVALAQANGERCYHSHKNGNPVGADGTLLKLWDYTNEELVNFVNTCEQDGITFIATEWGLPNLSVLAGNPRVTLITCMRNPIDRFVSNFYFDLYLGFTPARSPEAYVGSRNRTITMPNYYCRVLSGHNNSSSNISEEEYLLAKNALGKFDGVFLLEEGLSALSSMLGWSIERHHVNKTKFGLRHIAGLLKQRKFGLVLIWLRYRKKDVSRDFIKSWNSKNYWDLLLYENVSQDLT